MIGSLAPVFSGTGLGGLGRTLSSWGNCSDVLSGVGGLVACSSIVVSSAGNPDIQDTSDDVPDSFPGMPEISDMLTEIIPAEATLVLE